MIDFRQELEDYKPIDLESIKQNGVNIPENIKNSIALYNKALESIKINSEDIAIIELKKSVALNKELHEAINLLGLCYYYTKEYSKAKEMFGRVIDAGNNSIKALGYLNELNADSAVRSTPRSTPPEAKNENKKERIIKDKANIARFIIGIAIGAFLMFLINIPLNNNKNISVPNTTDNGKVMDSSNSDMYKAKLDTVNEELEKLKKSSEADASEVNYYKNAAKLFEIERMLSSKNFEGGADELVLLGAVGFKGMEKEKFDSLYAIAMSKVLWPTFNEGTSLMKSKNYQEALNKFSKLKLYSPNWSYMDNVLYYMGTCYKELNDSRNAIEAFQKIKDNYPNSQFSKYADSNIKKLTEVP